MKKSLKIAYHHIRDYLFPHMPNLEKSILPIHNNHYESNIKGLYVVGELTGRSLVKNGLNMGHEVVKHLVPYFEKRKNSDSLGDKDIYDLVIIGGASAGISAAMTAQKHGLNYILLERGNLFQTIRNFPKGKTIFAEPLNMPNMSELDFPDEIKKEELLEKWTKQVEDTKINYRTGVWINDVVKKSKDEFDVICKQGEVFKGHKVILAIGKGGAPRKIGVAGENLEKVSHYLSDPEIYNNKKIMIYGGGDVACEAAISLAEKNQVTLATLDSDWIYPKKRNIDKVNALAAENKLDVHFETKIQEIKENEVIISTNGTKSKETIQNDYFFTMIGAEFPAQFLSKIGLKLEGSWYRNRYLYLIGTFILLFLITTFLAKPYIAASFIPDVVMQKVNNFLSFDINIGVYNIKKSPTFWYAFIYTILVTVFGIFAIFRWGRGKGIKYSYQRWRYISLIFFQLALFVLGEFVNGYYYLSVYGWPLSLSGITEPFTIAAKNSVPLVDQTLFWYGLALVFLILPLSALFQGKKFCTWVCGCGALAETLADRWRHMSPKGQKSRNWEFMNIVIFIFAIAMTIWVFIDTYLNHQNMNYPVGKMIYDYIVDFWLITLIPLALYPFYGGKIWCRYWCPMAKYLEFISKLGI
ncbi:MAG: NAD(P)-binding domain-containing protein, partial [Spirochaetota bacterium]|nr:NAD(P)-binding domain-containing protein [Spirochaetota bacterium]